VALWGSPTDWDPALRAVLDPLIFVLLEPLKYFALALLFLLLGDRKPISQPPASGTGEPANLFVGMIVTPIALGVAIAVVILMLSLHRVLLLQASPKRRVTTAFDNALQIAGLL
jgi:hypothetical protein